MKYSKLNTVILFCHCFCFLALVSFRNQFKLYTYVYISRTKLLGVVLLWSCRYIKVWMRSRLRPSRLTTLPNTYAPPPPIFLSSPFLLTSRPLLFFKTILLPCPLVSDCLYHSDYYMSPPAGDIYCSSLRVCPSVRLSVRPCVTLSCPSHISKNPSCKKIAKNYKNNIPTEVVQQKVKIPFCQKFWKFWPKNHFLDLCFVQARSR